MITGKEFRRNVTHLKKVPESNDMNSQIEVETAGEIEDQPEEVEVSDPEKDKEENQGKDRKSVV